MNFTGVSDDTLGMRLSAFSQNVVAMHTGGELHRG